MLKITITVLFLSFSVCALAQAFEDQIEYDKKKQACIARNFDFPVEALENAFLQKMDRLGYQGKEEKGLFNKNKGFRVYKEATIKDISSDKFDYVVYFEKKSKRNDDESVMYLLILKDEVNAIASMSKDGIKKAKDFLNSLVPDVDAANLELQITAQEEAVSSAEKKLRSLKEEMDDLEKKIRNNQKDQEDQVKEIEVQKKVLEDLKAKRKN